MKSTTTKKAKPTALKAKPIEMGKIVHRLPGRVRVRIDRLHNDIKYGDDLKQAVTTLRGVTEVRVNTLASSIVISYHSSELPEQKVLDCLGVAFPIPEAAKPSEHPVTDNSDAQPDADLVKEAEQFTTEIASETVCESIGEVVGETVGELLMGPIGMAIGAEVGAKLGGEVGESIGNIVEESIESQDSKEANPPPNPTELNPAPDRNSQKPPRQKK